MSDAKLTPTARERAAELIRKTIGLDDAHAVCNFDKKVAHIVACLYPDPSEPEGARTQARLVVDPEGENQDGRPMFWAVIDGTVRYVYDDTSRNTVKTRDWLQQHGGGDNLGTQISNRNPRFHPTIARCAVWADLLANPTEPAPPEEVTGPSGRSFRKRGDSLEVLGGFVPCWCPVGSMIALDDVPTVAALLATGATT